MSTGNFLESMSQAMLVGIMLVGRLGVSEASIEQERNFRPIQLPEIFRHCLYWFEERFSSQTMRRFPATINLWFILKRKNVHEKLSKFVSGDFTEVCLSEIVLVHARSALREFAHKNLNHRILNNSFARENFESLRGLTGPGERPDAPAATRTSSLRRSFRTPFRSPQTPSFQTPFGSPPACWPNPSLAQAIQKCTKRA